VRLLGVGVHGLAAAGQPVPTVAALPFDGEA
jgi:hypothetical protein